MQRDRGLDAFDDKFVKRAGEAHHAAVAGATVNNQLGDHAVIIWRDRITGIEAAVDADMHAAGWMIAGNLARRWSPGFRVFGIDPAFDGVAAEYQFFLGDRQVATVGDANLFAHQIEARDHFGHRMLDLQPGVHLDKIEFVVLVQKLDRAGAAILHALHRIDADLAHGFTLFGADHRRRRFLEHFLMPALQGTVALAEMDRVATAITEHLEFDMARITEIFLDIDSGIAERGLGLGTGLFHLGFEFGLAVDHFHTATATTGCCLDDHRIADIFRHPFGFLDLADRAIGAGNQGNPEIARGLLGCNLVAHDLDMLGLGADPLDIMRFDHFGKMRIFREKAVAGMDRICAADLGGRDDRRDRQIAVGGRRRADADRLIGKTHMHRVGVCGAVHGYGLDAEFLGCAQNPQGNFPAIGDQDFFNRHFLEPPVPVVTSAGETQLVMSSVSRRRSRRTECLGHHLGNHHQRLVIFDRLTIFDEDRLDRAGRFGGDRVHHLHCFDNQQCVTHSDLVADADEIFCTRFGSKIGGADHRRLLRPRMIISRCSRCFGRRCWCRRCWRSHGRSRNKGSAPTRDLDLAVAIFDLDLGQSGFVENGRQIAHQFNVHIHAFTRFFLCRHILSLCCR